MPKQALVAAPLTGLFLILTVVAVLSLSTPQGFVVEFADRIQDCGDSRTVVISVADDGSLRINQEGVESDELENRLHEVFGTRVERVVFLRADCDVAFQKVAEIIDKAQKQVDCVALLTPAVQQKTGCLIVVRPAPIKPQTHVDLPPWMHLLPLWPW